VRKPQSTIPLPDAMKKGPKKGKPDETGRGWSYLRRYYGAWKDETAATRHIETGKKREQRTRCALPSPVRNRRSGKLTPRMASLRGPRMGWAADLGNHPFGERREKKKEGWERKGTYHPTM